MFTKKFKLICSVIGLVAVLVMGLAVPGVTQQIELLTRAQIVKGLSQLIATLTASEGDILDVESAGFISHPKATAAVIPLHPSSRSAQLLWDWLKKGEPFGDFLNIGALYLENDVPSCPAGYDPLKAGIYQLKVRKDLKLIAVDSNGNEFVAGYVEIKNPQLLASAAVVSVPWPLVGALIWLCATSDVNLACIRYTECRYVERAPGTYERECVEKEWCMGC